MGGKILYFSRILKMHSYFFHVLCENYRSAHLYINYRTSNIQCHWMEINMTGKKIINFFSLSFEKKILPFDFFPEQLEM